MQINVDEFMLKEIQAYNQRRDDYLAEPNSKDSQYRFECAAESLAEWLSQQVSYQQQKGDK